MSVKSKVGEKIKKLTDKCLDNSPYRCPTCSKKFRSAVGLKLHCEQSHNGEA